MSVEYNESNIEVLEGLDPVKKRPGMYIGSTAAEGLHHLVYEIVDNAVDEAMAGECDEITVTILKDDTVTVTDNGRGIPVGIHPTKGIPAVELVYTTLHAGGKFGGDTSVYKVSGGLHGVGASVVNALSEEMQVTIFTDGKIHEIKFERGETVSPLTVIGTTECHGTTVHFKPDADIFETTIFDYSTLKRRLREMAFLTKGLKISLTDEREGQEDTRTFHYEGGIKEFVGYINKNKDIIFNEIFYVDVMKDGINVEIAIQYNDTYQENTLSFANNINTAEGGTHVVGFRSGLTKTINEYGRKFGLIKDNDKNLSGDDVREGLTCIISVKIGNPQFEGQTKSKLGTSEAKSAVESVMNEYFKYFLEENPNVGKAIIEKAMLASRARDAARKAKDLVRRKSALEGNRMPGKLADCSEKDPEKCEIYLVEGDSAGGTVKNARTSLTQAVLPLRGKILNVEKARMDRILGNEEIKAMITAFGTGIHEDCDISKLRYHKIVLMTDADVDGAHIRTLLLTFFYRFMQPLIENGKVYVAQPPLYKVEKGKNEYYLYSDEELKTLLNEIGRDGIKPIQRYKGLGEMDADQLWDTTMDPEKRTLLRVDISDAIEADQIFTTLMGEKVEPRREFIFNNRDLADDLDV